MRRKLALGVVILFVSALLGSLTYVVGPVALVGVALASAVATTVAWAITVLVESR